METVTLSDRVDVYRVRTLPKATVRWPAVASDHHALNGNGHRHGAQARLAEQLMEYRATRVPGRLLVGSRWVPNPIASASRPSLGRALIGTR